MHTFSYFLISFFISLVRAATFSCVTFPEEAWQQGTRYQLHGKDYLLLGYHVTLAENKDSIERIGLMSTPDGRYGEGAYVGYDIPHLLDTYPEGNENAPNKVVCSVFAPIDKVMKTRWCPTFANYVDPDSDITRGAIKAVHQDRDGIYFYGRPHYTSITPHLLHYLEAICEPVHDRHTFRPTAQSPVYAEVYEENGGCWLNGYPGTRTNKPFFSLQLFGYSFQWEFGTS